MINLPHLLKVTFVWINAVYAVCYAGVALLPGIREGFMKYALHTDMELGQNIISIETFVAGLVIWNATALLSVGLFAYLFNAIKK